MDDNYIHFDFFGDEIKVGDAVVAGQGRELECYLVVKLTKKMVRVTRSRQKKSPRAKNEVLRYPHELAKVAKVKATYYALANLNN